MQESPTHEQQPNRSTAKLEVLGNPRTAPILGSQFSSGKITYDSESTALWSAKVEGATCLRYEEENSRLGPAWLVREGQWDTFSLGAEHRAVE